jgi:hypothetical protein
MGSAIAPTTEFPVKCGEDAHEAESVYTRNRLSTRNVVRRRALNETSEFNEVAMSYHSSKVLVAELKF